MNQTPTHPAVYSGAVYRLPHELIRSLSRVSEPRAIAAIITAWVGALGLIFGFRFWLPEALRPYLYLPVLFFIAGRQGALLQLVHEGAHGLLSSNRRRNSRWARWFCALPLGLSFDGYTAGHLRHHWHTGTDQDPRSDTEKYRVVDARDPRLYLLLLKDLFGFTALSVFFDYEKNETEKNHTQEGGTIPGLAQIAVVQIVLLGVVFQLNVVEYLKLWLLPATSAHMVLMRIRGIAEHGLAKQMGNATHSVSEGTLFTRSFLTPERRYRLLPLVWLERALIGSFRVGYHHEHHLFPSVPFYRLPDLHQRIAKQIANANSEVYVSGYFAAAFRTIARPMKRANSFVPGLAWEGASS